MINIESMGMNINSKSIDLRDIHYLNEESRNLIHSNRNIINTVFKHYHDNGLYPSYKNMMRNFRDRIQVLQQFMRMRILIETFQPEKPVELTFLGFLLAEHMDKNCYFSELQQLYQLLDKKHNNDIATIAFDEVMAEFYPKDKNCPKIQAFIQNVLGILSLMTPSVVGFGRAAENRVINQIFINDSILESQTFEEYWQKNINLWTNGERHLHSKPIQPTDFGGTLIHESGFYTDGIKQISLPRANASDWTDIETDYEVSKRAFAKKIRFVKDTFKRKIIFRDIIHSVALFKTGFYKPALILAGGVIEEMIRLYLIDKDIKISSNKFEDYIKACEEHRLLKSGITSLSTSARHFRNLVHLECEKTKKHAISKSAATGAIASIFTIANDF